MHSLVSPAILYWGSTVVLISTENEDGTMNIAPMSSAWWIGQRCMLGLAAQSQTTINILRTKQCVLNLPSDTMGDQVNALARTTGTETVPLGKQARGYYYVKDKFGLAGLSPQPSDVVRPSRIEECPVQMEAELAESHEMMKDLTVRGVILALEVKIIRIHAEDSIRLVGHKDRIDADKWRPMVMSFQDLYGLAPRKIIPSKLAEINEELYRFPNTPSISALEYQEGV